MNNVTHILSMTLILKIEDSFYTFYNNHIPQSKQEQEQPVEIVKWYGTQEKLKWRKVDTSKQHHPPKQYCSEEILVVKWIDLPHKFS